MLHWWGWWGVVDSFVVNSRRKDDYFPEDWLASTIKALNGEHSQGPHEGLARVAADDGSPVELFADLLSQHGPDILGLAHFRRYGPILAYLCKYLNSAVRLPI